MTETACDSIAFGDSYTFLQGTTGHPGYTFIGDYLPGNFSFTPEELLSNRIIQKWGGTSAGGPNWVQFLTGCAVERGEYLPSECDVQLWDFAYAGACYSEEFAPLHHNDTVQMVNQTQQYLTWADPVIGPNMDKSKALIAVWIGINDLVDVAKEGVDTDQVYEDIIAAMFAQSAQWLYDAGYRHFVFLNQPPRERTPGNLNNADPMPSRSMSESWNESLERLNKKFRRTHKDATSLVYDVHGLFNKVLDSPEEYGFHTTTKLCPGTRNETVLTDPEEFGCTAPIGGYFWWDAGHM